MVGRFSGEVKWAPARRGLMKMTHWAANGTLLKVVKAAIQSVLVAPCGRKALLDLEVLAGEFQGAAALGDDPDRGLGRSSAV